VGCNQSAVTDCTYSKVPVVLVEMCDVEGEKVEEFLNSKEGHRKMAAALAQGVRSAVKIRSRIHHPPRCGFANSIPFALTALAARSPAGLLGKGNSTTTLAPPPSLFKKAQVP
jgi:hypothetical protein